MNALYLIPHIRDWLERQPLVPMLVTGFIIGAGVGTWSLWGLGGWWGGLVCLLLVSLATALSWGAEPVLEVAVESTEGSEKQKEPPKKPYVVEEIPGLLSMVELEGGSFWMGSDEDDSEKPRHKVTISDFAIMQTPVTRGLFRKVMKKKRIPQEWDKKAEDELLPATNVKWFTAVEFCNILSERQGMTPCYKYWFGIVTWNRKADGYRLPTEAEWEYACRAGTETRWFCGHDEKTLADYAWFDKDWGEGPFPVTQKKPNPWHLYDMSGNVWEWCWDWYGPYSKKSQDNPTGPKRGEYRLLRGGSFVYPAHFLRSAHRFRGEPGSRGRNGGFRCVHAPRRQS